MEHKSTLQFPHSGQFILLGQHRKMIGIGISFFIHAVGVCCVVLMSSGFSNFTPPLRIDFSIQKTYDVPKVSNASEISAVQEVPKVQMETSKIVHKQVNVPAVVQQMAPPKKLLPEIVKVAIPKKIVPRMTKKKMVAVIPTPAVEKEVVPESVKEIIKPLAEIIPEKAITSIKSVDDFDRSVTATVPAVVAEKKMIKTVFSPKKQYLKEHFLYIKNNIQNKISYPRMARKMGWQGRVLISFVVCEDGSVKDIRIIESSGFKALDKNAVEVIQKIAPFPKPPVSAELIIPVTYKLI